MVPPIQRYDIVRRVRVLDVYGLPLYARRQGCRALFAARVSLTITVTRPYVYPQARHGGECSRNYDGCNFSDAM